MNTKYFTGLILWLLPIILSAQSTYKNFDSHENQFPEQRRGKWVVDSTWFYLGNTFGQYWFNNEQYRVTGRDEYGNVKNSLTIQFDTISLTWIDKSRNVADYYDSVKLQKWIAEIWDSNADNWKMSDSIFLNESGSPEISWYKIWSPVKFRFSGGKRVDYEYAESGQLTQENIQLFDTLSGNWKNGQIANYTYNSDGLPEQKLLKTWDVENFWRDSLRITYTYNDIKLLITTLHEVMNGSEQWENYWKWEYNYNTNGKIREEFQYAWISSGWSNKNYTINSYDGLLLTQVLRKVWDENELVWVDKNRTTYTYNPNGQRTEVLGEYYDQYGLTWFRSYTYSYSYDENGNRTEFLYRIWDEPNGEWINFYKEFSYWSEFESFAVGENQWLKVRVYPNPTAAELNIQMEEKVKSGVILLTGLDGKTLLRKPFLGNFVRIVTENFPVGCYMLCIETGLGSSSQMVIIE